MGEVSPLATQREVATMSTVSSILDDVRAQLAPTDKVLKAARDRPGLVLAAAARFPGTLRSYNSGSIAHGTANSDLDADCGIVLDRREYPELGPDGDDVGPTGPVGQVVSIISAELAGEGSRLTIETSKRAITVSFGAPIDGYDPSVDLIVALTRRCGEGLWIPNLHADDWDASHPEKHTDLFTSGTRTLRRVRARAVRLAKGWNGQFADPALSSFNLEAIAWECVEEDMSEASALARTFHHGAEQLRVQNTPDPAEVSPPIKLLVDRSLAVERLEKAAQQMDRAIQNEDDEDSAREALSELFWEYVDPPAGSSSKAAWAASLRSGNEAVSVGAAGLELNAPRPGLKNARSWGDGA